MLNTSSVVTGIYLVRLNKASKLFFGLADKAIQQLRDLE